LRFGLSGDVSQRVEKLIERDRIVPPMPLGPPDLHDSREITALDEVKQQIVALHESPGTAHLHLRAERPHIALVEDDVDASQRDTVREIDADASTHLLDLTQPAGAGFSGVETGQVIANAATASAARPCVWTARRLVALRQ
jgi:hypothetical protein